VWTHLKGSLANLTRRNVSQLTGLVEMRNPAHLPEEVSAMSWKWYDSSAW
jgi:hypothetical protein